MLRSVTFEVVGSPQLHCESCEHRVERALKPVPGVIRIRANARNQRVDVLFDTGILDPETIADRIREVGYETRVGNATSAP